MIFKQYRIRAGLTQEQVAEKLGLDRTTVSKWDLNINLPRAELLPKIALLYSCDVSDLLSSGDPEPHNNSISETEETQND